MAKSKPSGIDLIAAVTETIRSNLPRSAVEANAENGAIWCTPWVSVVAEAKTPSVIVQALDPQLRATLGPPAVFSVNSSIAVVRNAVMARFAPKWASSQPRKAVSRPAGGAICGAEMRGGIDVAIIATQKRIETTHYWLRDNIGLLTSADDDPEVCMLESYMLYLSMLVDTAQSGMACLATHALDRSVIVFERLIVEYAVRAHYALRHRDYTLWLTTIGQAHDHYRRLSAVGAGSQELAAADKVLQEARTRFPHLVEKAKAAAWKDLQFKTMFEEVATAEQHVSLYRWPSVFIHGDPLGMRELFQTSADGRIQGVARLSDEDLNSDLIDSSSMLIEFLRAFQATFTGLRNSATAKSHIEELDRENMVHTLRYPNERQSEYLMHARAELGIDRHDS